MKNLFFFRLFSKQKSISIEIISNQLNLQLDLGNHNILNQYQYNGFAKSSRNRYSILNCRFTQSLMERFNFTMHLCANKIQCLMLNNLRLTAPVIDLILFFFLLHITNLFSLRYVYAVWIWNRNFYNSMRIRKIFINLCWTFWVRQWGWLNFVFFSWNRYSIRIPKVPFIAIYIYIYIDICFCSIVCLLREQIKLNRCDRLWPFVQSSDTVFVFGYLFIFDLLLDITKLFLR